MEGIIYKEIKPEKPLSNFVESFWMLSNTTERDKPIIVVPDGRIDLFFSFDKPFRLTLLGLENEPSKTVLEANTQMFAISFTPLAIEYFFDQNFPTLAEVAYFLPPDFFRISILNFQNFEDFCDILSKELSKKITPKIDSRKVQLFELLYVSKGSMTVSEISEATNWSSRQINRYFNQKFGISLKAYCTILRFKASFQQIKEGRFYPEQNFTDQAHFIKNVRRFSGATPRELNKNENDRFIQFSIFDED